MVRIFTAVALIGLTAFFAVSCKPYVDPFANSRDENSNPLGRTVTLPDGSLKFEHGHYVKAIPNPNGQGWVTTWIAD